MQVKLESQDDIKCVNWLAVAEQIGKHAREKIAEAMTRAGEELKTLKPGESRKIIIEIGTIEISRELDSSGHLSAEVSG